MSHSHQSSGAAVQRVQKLHATVLRACLGCGAPGYWHDVDPTINPGCYAPARVTQLGQDPVGDVCPNCGADRVGIEPHGEIWRREWRVSLRAVIGDSLRRLVRSLNPLAWRTR